MEILELLQQPWAIRAIYASSLVGIMCGVLGCFVVLRNMAMIGDALSHAVLPGIVVGFLLAGGMSLTAFFLGSVAAALFSAVLMTWIQQNVKTKNDAAIGIVFTAMFSIGVIGISRLSRKEGFHLDTKDFLFGNVLGVSNADLNLTLGVSIVVIIAVIIFYRYLFASTFQPEVANTMGISTKVVHYLLMLLLSFAIVASLRTVGVILVVAMLIIPASTALLLSNHLKVVIILSALLGLLAAIAGFLLSYLLETTPGPAMTVVATFIYLLVAIISPTNGLLFKEIRKIKEKRRIIREDVLKQALKLHQNHTLSIDNLSERIGYGTGKIKIILTRMSQKGWIKINQNELSLTVEGMRQAQKLVRAHRLWETYLVNEMGVAEIHIHQDAEDHEHHLSDDMLDELDSYLDFPDRDPHGSPIPKKH